METTAAISLDSHFGMQIQARAAIYLHTQFFLHTGQK